MTDNAEEAAGTSERRVNYAPDDEERRVTWENTVDIPWASWGGPDDTSIVLEFRFTRWHDERAYQHFATTWEDDPEDNEDGHGVFRFGYLYRQETSHLIDGKRVTILSYPTKMIEQEVADMSEMLYAAEVPKSTSSAYYHYTGHVWDRYAENYQGVPTIIREYAIGIGHDHIFEGGETYNSHHNETPEFVNYYEGGPVRTHPRRGWDMPGDFEIPPESMGLGRDENPGRENRATYDLWDHLNGTKGDAGPTAANREWGQAYADIRQVIPKVDERYIDVGVRERSPTSAGDNYYAGYILSSSAMDTLRFDLDSRRPENGIRGVWGVKVNLSDTEKTGEIAGLNGAEEWTADAKTLWLRQVSLDNLTAVPGLQRYVLDDEDKGPFENVIGTNIADIIVGNDLDNMLHGQGGRDQIWGGKGADDIHGGAHSDHLYGGQGTDKIVGDEGNDHLEGNGGDDRIWGNDGYDIILGGVGNDTIDGGDHLDVISGGADDDVIYGGGGGDIIGGGPGNDRVGGGEGDDTLFGEDGNDTLGGGPGADKLYGGAGNDLLLGNEDSDTLYGGTGEDILIFGDGDVLYGGETSAVENYSAEQQAEEGFLANLPDVSRDNDFDVVLLPKVRQMKGDPDTGNADPGAYEKVVITYGGTRGEVRATPIDQFGYGREYALPGAEQSAAFYDIEGWKFDSPAHTLVVYGYNPSDCPATPAYRALRDHLG